MPIAKKYAKQNNKRIFPISASQMDRHFKDILQVAKLQDQGITVHALRHTFATRCAENEVNPKITQKMLGHSNFAITMDVYTHVNNDFESQEIEKYNRRLEVS